MWCTKLLPFAMLFLFKFFFSLYFIRYMSVLENFLYLWLLFFFFALSFLYLDCKFSSFVFFGSLNTSKDVMCTTSDHFNDSQWILVVLRLLWWRKNNFFLLFLFKFHGIFPFLVGFWLCYCNYASCSMLKCKAFLSDFSIAFVAFFYSFIFR